MPAVSGENVLRHILETRDLSQAKPSRGTGIAEPTITAILSGKRSLNLDHITALAAYLKVSPVLFIPV